MSNEASSGLLRRVPVWARWITFALISFGASETIPAVVNEALLLRPDHKLTTAGWFVVLLMVAAVGSLLVGVILGLGSIGDRKRRSQQLALATQEQATHEYGMTEAARLFTTLVAGDAPLQRQVWDIVASPDEHIHLDLTAGYSRFYGRDVTYRTGGRLLFGPPGIVAVGMLAGAISDSNTASRARAAATPQWRDHQTSRVLLTTQRLVCDVNGQWMDFYYNSITAMHPALDVRGSVVLEFSGPAGPLCLSGPYVPIIAVYLCHALHGGAPGLQRHPSLEPVRARTTQIAN